MKFHINKAKLSAIILSILMVTSIAMITTSVQPVQGQLAASQPVSGPLPAGVTPDISVPTLLFLSFRPSTIGVNQELLVNVWTNPALASNNRYFPDAFIITLTKPDGTKDVIKMDSEAATGAAWFSYYPNQVGNWTIKFDFLGTYFPAGQYYNGYVVTNSSGNLYGSAYYQPASTKEQALTVQQDFVASWPPTALPTDYWSYPIAMENRDWWPILGNYPATGYQGGGPMWDALYPNTNPCWSNIYNFIPWVQGPNSAHIVWKQQRGIAGIIGGPAGQEGLTSDPGNPSVVYAGRCYQTMTVQNNGVPTSCAVCYDLRTGTQYYAIPIAQGGVTPAYISYVDPVATTSGSPGEVGSVLAASSWTIELLTISSGYLIKVNPWTGAITGNYSISPLTTGTFYNQMGGGYVLSIQTIGTGASTHYQLINWTTRGTSTTLAARIISNTTYAMSSLPSFIDYSTGLGASVAEVMPYGLSARYGAIVLIYDLKTGTLLHNITTGSEAILYSLGGSGPADHGKFAFWTQHGNIMCYDMRTGRLAWAGEQTEYPWASSGFGAYNIQSAYGMIFYSTYAGVYAFNWTNGKIVWQYKSPSYANFESPYIENGTEIYPFRSNNVIADGKIYCWNVEHTESTPYARGWGVYCINVTTGEEIWKVSIDGDSGVGAIANGYMTFAANRDGTMYVFGKGQSATTVTTSPAVTTNGQTVLIQGTVLDQSPAQVGTPCVSKDSMQTQMEYIHKQHPIDGIWHNLTMTGVPVMLTAIGSDGTVIDIGTTTTSAYYGTFSEAWTPPKADTYQIIATFTGDDSYGSSNAATAVVIGPAPATPTPVVTSAPINAATTTDLMTYIVGVGIAIIIAIAIVGILILRKH